MDALGRSWVSGCGLVALLTLALLTSGVAVVQWRSATHARREPLSPTERRAVLGQALITLSIALAFWLLLVVAWLFQGLGRQLGAPWPP